MKAYLDSVIDEINLHLADGMNDFRYVIKGLIKVVPFDENDTMIMQDAQGNSFAGVDDRYDIVLWHRADTTEFQQQDNTFGEGIDDYNAITNVTLYGYCNSLPNVNAHKFVQQLQKALPTRVNILNQNERGVGSNIIELTSVNYNSVEVFNQVYEGIPYNLRVSDNLVSVSYTITSDINKSCFDRCFNC